MTHNAAQTHLLAATVANDDTELKREVEALVYNAVKDVLHMMLQHHDPVLNHFSTYVIQDNRYIIERIALVAIKNHFNNPQHITNY